MAIGDGFSGRNLSTTTAAFGLRGGFYRVAAGGGFGAAGSVRLLQARSGGWLPISARGWRVPPTGFSKAGETKSWLPPGTYRFEVRGGAARVSAVVEALI